MLTKVPPAGRWHVLLTPPGGHFSTFPPLSQCSTCDRGSPKVPFEVADSSVCRRVPQQRCLSVRLLLCNDTCHEPVIRYKTIQSTPCCFSDANPGAITELRYVYSPVDFPELKKGTSKSRGGEEASQMKLCENLVVELSEQEDSWPFAKPVSRRDVRITDTHYHSNTQINR